MLYHGFLVMGAGTKGPTRSRFASKRELGRKGRHYNAERGEKFEETNLQVRGLAQSRSRIMNTGPKRGVQRRHCHVPSHQKMIFLSEDSSFPASAQRSSLGKFSHYYGWRAPQRCPRRRRQVARLPPLPAHIPRSAETDGRRSRHKAVLANRCIHFGPR